MTSVVQRQARGSQSRSMALGGATIFLGVGAALVLAAAVGVGVVVAGPALSNSLAAAIGALIVGSSAAAIFAFRRAFVASGPVRRAIAMAMLEDVDGRLVTDPSGSVVFANAAFRAMTMATDDRSAPLSAAFDDNQDTRDRLTRLAARASAGATSREDFSVTLADGGRRWLGVVGYPLAGMPGHVVWAVADVTAEREVAKAAREELGRLADFFDHAPVGLFSVDLEGRFRLVNDVLARWLEQDPDRMVADGVLIDDFIRPADSTKVLPKSWAEQWEARPSWLRLPAPRGPSTSAKGLPLMATARRCTPGRWPGICRTSANWRKRCAGPRKASAGSSILPLWELSWSMAVAKWWKPTPPFAP